MNLNIGTTTEKEDVFDATVTKSVSARCCYPWHPTSAPVLPPPDALRFGRPPPAFRGVSLPAVALNPTSNSFAGRFCLILRLGGITFWNHFIGRPVVIPWTNPGMNGPLQLFPDSFGTWKTVMSFNLQSTPCVCLEKLVSPSEQTQSMGRMELRSYWSLPYTSDAVVFNMFSWIRGNMICISQSKIQ